MSENESKSSKILEQEHNLSTQESNNAGLPVPRSTRPLTGNPYFTLVVGKCQLKPLYKLIIPTKFHKALPNATLQVIIEHQGKTWEIKYYGKGELKTLGRGWKKFALENNLKVGDACVFELIDDDKDKEIKLGVQILDGQLPVDFIKLGSAEKPIDVD